jgi:hypothetical protein
VEGYAPSKNDQYEIIMEWRYFDVIFIEHKFLEEIRICLITTFNEVDEITFFYTPPQLEPLNASTSTTHILCL